MRTAQKFQTFRTIVRDDCLRAGLAYLQSLTDYRYITVFRFNGSQLESVVHHDRMDPAAYQTAQQDIAATYCQFIQASRGVFTTAWASQDDRLINHIKSDCIAGYCGVPIFDALQNLWGTLCHYDTVPRDPLQLNMPLLVLATQKIAINLIPPRAGSHA